MWWSKGNREGKTTSNPLFEPPGGGGNRIEFWAERRPETFGERGDPSGGTYGEGRSHSKVQGEKKTNEETPTTKDARGTRTELCFAPWEEREGGAQKYQETRPVRGPVRWETRQRGRVLRDLQGGRGLKKPPLKTKKEGWT